MNNYCFFLILQLVRQLRFFCTGAARLSFLWIKSFLPFYLFVWNKVQETAIRTSASIQNHIDEIFILRYLIDYDGSKIIFISTRYTFMQLTKTFRLSTLYCYVVIETNIMKFLNSIITWDLLKCRLFWILLWYIRTLAKIPQKRKKYYWHK